MRTFPEWHVKAAAAAAATSTQRRRTAVSAIRGATAEILSFTIPEATDPQDAWIESTLQPYGGLFKVTRSGTKRLRNPSNRR